MVEDAGGRAVVRQMDVTRVAETRASIAAMADELGRLDVFVSNAGVGCDVPVLELEEADVERVLEVNLVGAFFASQAAARRMVEQGEGGRIVHVTSAQEHAPEPRAGAYAASKHGLGAFTKAMAAELGQLGITVNSVAPGPIVTQLSGVPDGDHAPRPRRDVPVGRTGHPDEVAAAIVHLTSPEASYVNGASLRVDGGLLAQLAGPPAEQTRPGLRARLRARLP
jgi:NAD(P)-dependent dehydrogenase (short-subunit alcohol dehydrogenase family)